jgi:hypothetical protein
MSHSWEIARGVRIIDVGQTPIYVRGPSLPTEGARPWLYVQDTRIGCLKFLLTTTVPESANIWGRTLHTVNSRQMHYLRFVKS